jgi:hypothetical protein
MNQSSNHRLSTYNNPLSDIDMPDSDPAPTALRPKTQSVISHLLTSIATNWAVASASSPFPSGFLPDPEPRNWGLPLLEKLEELRELSCQGLKNEAVFYVVRHLKERNGLWEVEEGGEFTYFPPLVE